MACGCSGPGCGCAPPSGFLGPSGSIGPGMRGGGVPPTHFLVPGASPKYPLPPTMFSTPMGIAASAQSARQRRLGLVPGGPLLAHVGESVLGARSHSIIDSTSRDGRDDLYGVSIVSMLSGGAGSLADLFEGAPPELEELLRLLLAARAPRPPPCEGVCVDTTESEPDAGTWEGGSGAGARDAAKAQAIASALTTMRNKVFDSAPADQAKWDKNCKGDNCACQPRIPDIETATKGAVCEDVILRTNRKSGQRTHKWRCIVKASGPCVHF